MILGASQNPGELLLEVLFLPGFKVFRNDFGLLSLRRRP